MKFVRISAVTIVLLSLISINIFTTNTKKNLTGAGATFPEPIYVKWADIYYKETGNKINYQGIGSSGGLKQIIANTVDFGASDTPLSKEKLNQEGLLQFPTIIGGIVLIINLQNIKSNELILDGKTLGDIYLGKIKTWNDKAIVKLNPNLKLPSQNIAVVRRADGSGTSFIFTNYLAKTNKEWKFKIGAGSTVNWPIGLGGKGNDGVAVFVQRLSGSIGYVEYNYAKQHNLAYTKLISANGKPVSPSEESFANAVKNTNWKKSFLQDLINQEGKNVWPITSTTYILINIQKKNTEQINEILKFFDWAYKKGSKKVNNLNYANLPDYIIEQIRISWKNNKKSNCNRLR